MTRVAHHGRVQHKAHHHHQPSAQQLARTLIRQHKLESVQIRQLIALLRQANARQATQTQSPDVFQPTRPGGKANTSDGDIDQLMAQLKKPSMPADPKDDKAMMKYQEEMQAYNRMVTMITNLIQMKHDSLKATLQNLRG